MREVIALDDTLTEAQIAAHGARAVVHSGYQVNPRLFTSQVAPAVPADYADPPSLTGDSAADNLARIDHLDQWLAAPPFPAALENLQRELLKYLNDTIFQLLGSLATDQPVDGATSRFNPPYPASVPSSPASPVRSDAAVSPPASPLPAASEGRRSAPSPPPSPGSPSYSPSVDPELENLKAEVQHLREDNAGLRAELARIRQELEKWRDRVQTFPPVAAQERLDWKRYTASFVHLAVESVNRYWCQGIGLERTFMLQTIQSLIATLEQTLDPTRLMLTQLVNFFGATVYHWTNRGATREGLANVFGDRAFQLTLLLLSTNNPELQQALLSMYPTDILQPVLDAIGPRCNACQGGFCPTPLVHHLVGKGINMCLPNTDTGRDTARLIQNVTDQVNVILRNTGRDALHVWTIDQLKDLLVTFQALKDIIEVRSFPGWDVAAHCSASCPFSLSLFIRYCRPFLAAWVA